MTKCQRDPACGIFTKRDLIKDITNYIPMCQTRKYKNINTQIHKHINTEHMKKCQKKQHVVFICDSHRLLGLVF